jgi:hypothetical protein
MARLATAQGGAGWRRCDSVVMAARPSSPHVTLSPVTGAGWAAQAQCPGRKSSVHSLSLSLDLAATLLGEEEAVIAEGDLVIAAISCSIHEGVDGCKTCHG